MSSTKSGGLPREILATKVIPFLVPISIETSLNLNQFNVYMATIKDMLQTVEIEQRKKLEQLSQQAANAPIVPIGPSATDVQFDQKSSMIDQFMLGQGFNSEVVQNKTMAASFDNNQSNDNVKSQQTSSNQSTSSDNSLGKKALTFEEKERMMRENDQTQRMKYDGEYTSERKTPTSTNIPSMAMTPISATVPTTTTSTSSAIYKDLTSNFFEQKSSQPVYSMSTSQTMPSIMRPTIVNSTSPSQQRPPLNTTDLTSSLLSNINSLASRPQTILPTVAMNSMSANTMMSHLNSGIMNGIIPLLQSIPSREPAVLMAILGIIKVAMSSTKSGGLPREILATKVIPFLVPISIETSLNLNQFNFYMATIKDMLQTVEIEQRKKLEQLSQQAANAPIVPIGPSATDIQFDQKSSMIDQFMLGQGFNSEVVQNKTMAASFDNNQSNDNVKSQQTLSNQSTSSDNSLGKKALTFEEKERMMRENDQTQRMKYDGEHTSERKTPTSTNIPLMAMTPISATVPTTSTSSAIYKDLTSNFFEKKSSQPVYSMSTSQTMPSIMRPTIVNSTTPSQQRPALNTTDLTSTLLSNINSLASRPQTILPTVAMNSMNANTMMSHLNSGIMNGSMGLFQSSPSNSIVNNKTSSKTASAELDDLFN
ncbi:unnamed protein product [Adineta steineri]|uniref:SCY1-like protein 2 n=1 Tax=Adineta steineri TaxID=433720 RepID=A0A814Q6L2_9BILA|nr:unnamed protein product [Adineta steineri]